MATCDGAVKYTNVAQDSLTPSGEAASPAATPSPFSESLSAASSSSAHSSALTCGLVPSGHRQYVSYAPISIESTESTRLRGREARSLLLTSAHAKQCPCEGQIVDIKHTVQHLMVTLVGLDGGRQHHIAAVCEQEICRDTISQNRNPSFCKAPEIVR